MNMLVQQRIDIIHPSDISAARRKAKTMAAVIGFEERAVEEIAIVVSELASNVLKHAGKGVVTLTQIDADGRTGIQIESLDRGPGIVDFEKAVTDGFSKSGSLGCGLGTVHRLTNELNCSPRETTGSGTHIICKRWLR